VRDRPPASADVSIPSQHRALRPDSNDPQATSSGKDVVDGIQSAIDSLDVLHRAFPQTAHWFANSSANLKAAGFERIAQWH
jgi:hypothetical protein